MTDTPAPVTAWAVVDKSDEIRLTALYLDKGTAEYNASVLNRLRWTKKTAPHRVVRVEIKVVETGEG